jgi:hypothetical protein
MTGSDLRVLVAFVVKKRRENQGFADCGKVRFEARMRMDLSLAAQFHLSIEVVVNGSVLIRRARTREVIYWNVAFCVGEELATFRKSPLFIRQKSSVD